jgi:hypothetical protein
MRIAILALGRVPPKWCIYDGQVPLSGSRYGCISLVDVKRRPVTSEVDFNYFWVIFELCGHPVLKAITCICASNKQDD